MRPPSPRLAAVILTGGTAVRLGGADKASIEVRGRTLLEHALAATAEADEVVVVGSQVPTTRPVSWTREDPAGGGPAAGLLAGVDALATPSQRVCVLAVDMPRFSRDTLRRLVAVLDSEGDAVDGVCLVDERGRQQWLAGVYRRDALVAARPAEREQEHGLPTRRLMLSLRIAEVPALAGEARDIDTWEDLCDLGD